ncbi:protein kinase domain-containing protein [Rosettibacter firmus]|uniref:protein kinase domain-containing protein n=1 Tax=Rosettibacter firmus TaxID=3111522 RepID=UPI00336BE70C
MENLIGILIDNYRIVSVLGKGGMGIVYKAYDTKLDRYVAIKMLNADTFDKARFVERFKREAKNQAKLSHPNIVTVYGFIEYDELLGIVMEYVEGESLEKVLQRQGRFNIYDVIYILKQILLGLGYAHSKGFVHRDIKPSNIILNREGIAKIMDFGISKSLFDDKDFTKPGAKIGTVYYMSPEQIKGGDVTNRSDIYSIGCTAYEMIVGRPPFDYDSEYDVMESHLKKSPQKISSILTGIPEDVDKVILKAMEKNPLNRYETCEEMYDALQELDKSVSKIYTSYFKKTEERSKSYKIASASAFAFFVILLIALSYFVYNQVHELIISNKLETLKKYDIKSLFSSKEDELKFSYIDKIESNVKNNLNSIFFVDEKNAIAVGDSGTIIISNDGGQTWKQKPVNIKSNLSDLYISPSGRTIIIGDSSTIIYGKNLLDSLQLLPIQKDFTFFRINFIDEHTGFITGNKGVILKTINGGINWYKVNTNTNSLIFDIDFFDDRRGFAVGWNGLILKTTNGGETWTRIDNVLTDNYLKSIDLERNGFGIIVGGDATVLRTTNYGEEWEFKKIADVGALQKVSFISKNYVALIGTKGTFMISKDKGANWDLVDIHNFTNMNDMALNYNGHIFLVGYNGQILKIH